MARPPSPDVDAALRRLEVVGELASLINTTFDLDQIFRAAVIKLQRVLRFRRASVVLVSDDREQYTLHTLYDAEQGGFAERRPTFPLDRGLTGYAIRTGQPMRVRRFEGTEGIRGPSERAVSALIVPLHVDGEVIGTLNLGAGAAETYEEEDLELAVLLGRQIETSLHYSKLLATIRSQREALAGKHAEAEAQRRRLEALIDASDAAILMVREGTVAHANREMAALLGFPREVVIGASLAQVNRALAPALRDPEALAAQNGALERGETLRDRVELVFPRQLTCQRTVAPVHGADGQVIGHLVMFRDVTREAQAEAAKSEFVSIVSHELRTPLTSVKTSLVLLLKGAAGAVSAAMREFLEIALRNLDRLIRLVDELLDLSRIESGRMVVELEPVSLPEVADRAVEAVQGFAAGRGVHLQREASEDAVTVVANPERLEQVFVNLLSNAIKFSNPGQGVGLRWWTESDGAVLEVADEGPGIPPDKLEAVFEKFQQLERAATRGHGGAGLGLTISRAIVQQCGGRIWAESEAGRGARFFVWLRLVPPPAQPQGSKT